MSLGPVMLDLDGTELSLAEQSLLRHPLVGGVILFSRNFGNAVQLMQLIHDIRTERPDILIAVDQEGGRIQRFRQGFTHLPPPRRLGEYYDHNPQAAKIFADTAGWIMACELRRFGVDFSFAPVLDLDHERSEVIGNRAFHSDPQAVTELAKAYILGMQRGGMQAVGKHFPGHGYVKADSHLTLPIDLRSLNEIKKMDLHPFAKLCQLNLLNGIMAAHIVVQDVDRFPVGFSEIWLKELLRKKHNFQGIIFSDCLSMNGAAKMGSFAERALAALNAGCDMILICNNRAGVLEILSALKNYVLPADLTERLSTLHGKSQIDQLDLNNDPAWQEGVNMLLNL